MMPDPLTDAENAGRMLRDLENARAWEPVKVEASGLDGLREYSEAWEQNRSSAYLIGKSWADPFNRWFLVAVVLVILVGWTFLLTL